MSINIFEKDGSYIHGSSQAQFVAESHIILLLRWALSLYLTDPTPTITDTQRAVVSSMSHPVNVAPSADGCTTQDYMHTDRYHDCP
ncbi:hypothetical protein NFI96_003234 [Prochilodus magdalenae]|nr:hypothetical protein NFI96_003234 [Prochilodus magdalenae]